MTMRAFNLKVVHPSWQTIIQSALTSVDPSYLQHLVNSSDWLPGPEKIFNAFSVPLMKVRYVLFGESPYPRRESANGYAFWDAAVRDLWSETGMNKKVNRATSLRNLIKMLLISEGLLSIRHHDQAAIAAVDKSTLIQTNEAFFGNFLQQGFLLLNASLVLQAGPPQKDARAWSPFLTAIVRHLIDQNPAIEFILFGQLANKIEKIFSARTINRICVEHPYNHSFITNPEVLAFFKPLHLLQNHTLVSQC